VRWCDDPFTLKRVPVNSLDDAALLRCKLQGDYDWLSLPQSLSKRLSISRSVRKQANTPADSNRPAVRN
jgi:hypothetical protein